MAGAATRPGGAARHLDRVGGGGVHAAGRGRCGAARSLAGWAERGSARGLGRHGTGGRAGRDPGRTPRRGAGRRSLRRPAGGVLAAAPVGVRRSVHARGGATAAAAPPGRERAARDPRPGGDDRGAAAGRSAHRRGGPGVGDRDRRGQLRRAGRQLPPCRPDHPPRGNSPPHRQRGHRPPREQRGHGQPRRTTGLRIPDHRAGPVAARSAVAVLRVLLPLRPVLRGHAGAHHRRPARLRRDARGLLHRVRRRLAARRAAYRAPARLAAADHARRHRGVVRHRAAAARPGRTGGAVTVRVRARRAGLGPLPADRDGVVPAPGRGRRPASRTGGERGSPGAVGAAGHHARRSGDRVARGAAHPADVRGGDPRAGPARGRALRPGRRREGTGPPAGPPGRHRSGGQ